MTHDGTVKVLDFGLAKAGGTGGEGEAERDLTHSPTVIAPTLGGALLGTAPYMSPEQARGKAVDKRTDIWAFGCVLYEMLSGRRAFAGDTMTDVLAKIVERDPDWAALPASTPPHVVRLLRRCLEKNPKARLRDIGDASGELAPDGLAAAIPAPGVRRMATLPVAAALALGVAAAIGMWLFRPTPPLRRPTQFEVGVPPGVHLQMASPASSPDGRRVAFTVTTVTGARAVWIRSLQSVVAQPLAGTDGATGQVFWSPDGVWLAFFADGKLKKIEATGGPALTICAMAANLGGTWNRDNVIVFAPVNRTVLHKVPAAGGTPEPITTLSTERKENSHRWPHFLPDGRHFLFTARSDVKEHNRIYVGSLDSREVVPVVAAQSGARYAGGYIFFARDATLMAQRFDVRALTVSGDPFAIAGGVDHITASSEGSFDAAADGSVVTYLAAVDHSQALTWFDRDGNQRATVGPRKEYQDVRLSPDGRRAAVVVPDPDSGNRDVWLLELATGNLTRFTSNPANDWQMVWSADGRDIAFASDRNGRSSVYRKPVDGGDEELLLRLPDRGVFPKDFSPDGLTLALGIDSVAGISGTWAMRLVGDRAPFPLGHPGSRENEVRFRNDGRWYAFESMESGASEIYLSMIGKSARSRVSNGGGVLPRWRSDGLELYYAAPNGDLMVVPVGGAEPAEPAAPVTLFSPCNGTVAGTRPQGGSLYDVTRDGSRFLVACPSATSSTIVVSVDGMPPVK